MLITLALAATLGYTPADFDKEDVGLLTVLVVESTFDVMHTRAHLKDGTWSGEADPLLGEHPSALRLWGSFVIAQVVAIGVAKVLPDPWRKIFEVVVTGAEFSVVTSNVVGTKQYYSWGETFKLSF